MITQGVFVLANGGGEVRAAGPRASPTVPGLPKRGYGAFVAVFGGVMLAGLLLLPAGVAVGAGIEAPWVDGYKSRVRLIGGQDVQNGTVRSVAGVEIELPPQWKTYWRNPGDAGGVPPEFDWSKSENVASANVLYPAPKRLSDETGDSIGYKSRVVFPVIVETKDAMRPAVLRLGIFYGVCFDICIPAEARIELELPAAGQADPGAVSEGLPEALPEALREALAKVPTTSAAASAPRLVGQSFVFDGERSHADLTADFGAGAEGADLFVEGPAGVYLPMAQRQGEAASGKALFRIDLSRVDKADLAGEAIRVTLVGSDGRQSETTVSVP